MKKVLNGLIFLFSFLLIFYLLLIFGNIPYLTYWRNIYIETAMTTGNHKWLATAFFPKPIIDKVMSKQVTNSSEISVTKIEPTKYKYNYPETEKTVENNPNKEVDINLKNANGLNYPSNAFSNLISSSGSGYNDPNSDENYERDIAGNKILIKDEEEGIIISQVKGKTYVGHVVLITDPSRVFVGFTDKKGVTGRNIKDLVEMHDAILGINASGFLDVNWQGNGGQIVGLSYSNGQAWGEYSAGYSTIALDRNNRLIVGGVKDWDSYDIRDGIQFAPALVINGEKKVKGSAGWGLQPRTAVGQRPDGTIIFVLIDGRKPGYSIGATMEDVADVMLSYGAYNAGACDGGSSTILYYKGKVINRPSSKSKYGRLLPNAFLVKKRY